ncbi:MAG: oxygenase MpaB family protein [Rhodoluna sp.]|nr:oxygenase MpaB family protein [Rhodoluna sp.]
MKNNAVQEFFSIRFRKLLSGAKDGTPPWLEIIAGGETGGLFLPNEGPWVVHRDFGTLVGGIRALLVQALQPATLAGVRNHSRYEQDPLGRLAGTIRWLTVTTFGSHAAVAGEASRVNRLHTKVVGEQPVSYRASDPHLLLWVHAAFTDSFLAAHELYCKAPIPGGADGYVSNWDRSVTPLGLEKAPKSKVELDEVMDSFFTELKVTDDTASVVRFIRKPPLPVLVRPAYAMLFQAAVVSLRPEHRELLGLKEPPRWLVIPVTRVLLRAIRVLIGPESPIEDGALRRLRRLGII